MNKIKSILLLFVMTITLSITAQSIGDYKDVIHFKNGTSIEGVIIEQVPGESIKVQANDGKVYFFPVEDIARFTRELSVKESKGGSEVVSTNSLAEQEEIVEDKIKWSDNFKLKKKGYFVEADLLLNTTAQGIRVTNGYKFGRFGLLGVAVGLENVVNNYWDLVTIPELTFNIVYSGEILNKRITPFYQVEVGYGIALDRKTDYSNYYYDLSIDSYYPLNQTIHFGGPMSAIALGVKFKTKRKIVYKLGLDARLVSQFSERTDSYYNYLNEFESFRNTSFNVNPGLGIRFGVGF